MNTTTITIETVEIAVYVGVGMILLSIGIIGLQLMQQSYQSKLKWTKWMITGVVILLLGVALTITLLIILAYFVEYPHFPNISGNSFKPYLQIMA